MLGELWVEVDDRGGIVPGCFDEGLVVGVAESQESHRGPSATLPRAQDVPFSA